MLGMFENQMCAHPEQTTPRARERKLRRMGLLVAPGEADHSESGPLPAPASPAGRQCYAVAGRVTCCYCDGSSNVQVKVAVWGLACRQQQCSFDHHQRQVVCIRDRSEIPFGTRACARARAHSHRPMRAHMHARARHACSQSAFAPCENRAKQCDTNHGPRATASSHVLLLG